MILLITYDAIDVDAVEKGPFKVLDFLTKTRRRRPSVCVLGSVANIFVSYVGLDVLLCND